MAALAVLFLLAFIASIYLAVLSRNIGRTQRSGSALQASYLAQAGIKYADTMLTQSADGADWRPEPQPTPNPRDPDYAYIKDGFTRVTQGDGRFLLRVSYMPVVVGSDGLPVDKSGKTTSDQTQMVYPATGRYIKIESIGRNGVVDPTDPTTWLRKDGLRRALVAYKPIGITDYVRFVTNKDRSDTAAVLGADLYALPAGNTSPFRTVWNGPVRVNGDLVWAGLNTLRLNSLDEHGGSVADYHGTTLNLLGVDRQDSVDVSGRIFHDPLPDGMSAPQALLENPAAAGDERDVTLAPSLLPNGLENPAFDTGGGVYRDGVAGGSAAGRLRGATRLEPPKMDEKEVNTGILRYRLVTRNSGVSPRGMNFNLGQFGLGRGIYLDNNNETQRNTSLRRLTDEWASPGTGRESDSLPQSGWRQHLYTAPGTEIYLDPTPAPQVNSGFDPSYSQGTIVVTRRDGRQWRDAEGRNDGYVRRFRYPKRAVYAADGAVVDTDRYETVANDPYRDRTGAYTTFQNGVIFAEGNIRISGKLPADWVAKNGRIVGQRLTVVTNSTAYIEGNLLKGDPVIADTPYGRGVQMSGIAILAKNYICVNTSAHFMRQPDAGPWTFNLGNAYSELGAAGQTFTTAGFSAVSPSRYPADNAGGARQRLLLLQTAEATPGGAAELRASWHGGGDSFSSGSFFVRAGEDVPMLVTPGISPVSPAENIWQHVGLPIAPSLGAAGTSWGAIGRAMEDWYTFTYRPYFDTSPLGNLPGGGSTFTQNYNQPVWLSRVALSPLDIRIEAVLFAQEGCFYVMPGEWLNTNPNDFRADNLQDSPRRVNPTVSGWRVEDNPDTSVYPFNGEPADIRVVINGAVAENMPAAREHQTAWMKHWGWTPMVRPDGSSGAHGGEGLTYLYDHTLRLPVRYDRFNRPLPPMPALPVSPDLVFYGEGA